MILESERIRLRPFKMDDLEAIHKWQNDSEIRFNAMMHPYPITIEQTREWLTQFSESLCNKNVGFAVEVKKDNILIGYFQLRELNQIQKHAFLGIVIGLPDFRGKGLGYEIINSGISFGFGSLGLHKISLEVLQQNTVATRLYEKIGFRKEGIFVEHFFFNGSFHDVIRMALFYNKE